MILMVSDLPPHFSLMYLGTNVNNCACRSDNMSKAFHS
jgi:hypothetical protein